jgi:hypothetical protein
MSLSFSRDKAKVAIKINYTFVLLLFYRSKLSFIYYSITLNLLKRDLFHLRLAKGYFQLMKEKRQIPPFQPYEFTAFRGTGEGARSYFHVRKLLLPTSQYLTFTLALHF